MQPPNEPYLQEIIDKFGHLPIWTARWHEFYVEHARHLQTFQQAKDLADQHKGSVLLPIGPAFTTKVESRPSGQH